MTRTPAAGERSFAFGAFVLIPARQLLLGESGPVRIGGRALDILTVLVERAGVVVSKAELLARVWPETVVEEANLKVNMAALRRALGDEPGAAPYIATVVGRGYRFVAPVRFVDGLDASLGEAGASASRHNLPAGLTRIFGRSETIDAIVRDLNDSRLLSIVGAGGIGKTTVALAAAERVVGRFPHGVWSVELASLKDPALVPSAIATSVGLTAHSASVLAALGELLRDRELLLVLDSCEHLIDAVAQCAGTLLAEAPRVKVVTTSREPLRVKGERVLRLTGLAAPPAATNPNARAALAFPAVQLFVDRATERMDSFELTDEDAPVVAEICRGLDGLSLAIELAATRVDAFSVSELRRQIYGRLDLLKGHRGSEERHRTLTATIDWSYELLSGPERLLMQRLSAFAGTFSLASACAVAVDERLGRGAVVAALSGLVAKSLVAAEAREAGVEYRQFDTTRAYALEKLTASGELERARLAHAEHVVQVGLMARAEHERLPREAWIARYGPKLDDLRDALRWASGSAAHARLVVPLTLASIPIWQALSLVDECCLAVERALAEELAPGRSERDDLVLNLTWGATLLHTRGPLLQVKTALVRALERAEKLGDQGAQLECLRGLSEYELWTGDTRSALAVAEKIRRLAGDAEGETAGAADASAGSALSYIGDLAASRRHLESLVERAIPERGRPDQARFEREQRLTARGTLAAVLWLQGFPDQAQEMARRQREEAEASYDAVSLCYALVHGSAVVALYVRDLDAAKHFFDAGIAHASKHGLTVWRAMATCARSRWFLDSGEPLDLAEFEAALAELREGGFRMRYANYLTNYGDALARRGDFEGAHARIDEAIELSKGRGQFLGIPEMLRIQGEVFKRRGSAFRDQALACYRESLDWAQRQGALSWELRTAMSLLELSREVGSGGEAESLLASAYGRFTEGVETGDLRRARALLSSRK